VSTIWVREFTSGLDTRRLPEAANAGVLVVANNGHITRGGEFEQRAAFVPTYSLPAGTVDLFATNTSLTVFGSIAAPAMPVGVVYQRLQHVDGTTPLLRVLSADLYRGKVYAVGEFADGAIFHFYDGVRVTDWYDGRARATFRVTSGGIAPATAATGAFEITGGTNDAANRIDVITIDGVSLMPGAVPHTGDNATTAAAVALAINSLTSSPDYVATSIGQRVIISAALTGPVANGRLISVTLAGDVTIGGLTTMNGGTDATPATLTGMQINGVSVIAAPVLWSASNEAMASAIASAINGLSSVPDYTATAVGNIVNVAAATPGAASNGFAVTFNVANGLVLTPNLDLVLANGADSAGTYQPGSFVRTISQKVYSTSGPVMHFSGIQTPTKWTTDVVGAGFIDLSTENSGAEQLTALARYQNYVAVFAGRVVQIWYVDPDPNLNRLFQVLENTGTDSGRSITAFGDADIFYLDVSGLRSLRARDSSNAAATTDIGVPVDDLVVPKLESLTDSERQQVVGLIEPSSGRFWLVMRDKIFVFSFFGEAKVSAWSTYDASYEDDDGEQVPFAVDAAVVFRRRVYVRAGNTIFTYGGATGAQHDNVVAEAWLPYLDADDPTRRKQFQGVDAALRGQWQVNAAMLTTNTAAEDKIAVLDVTTFDGGGSVAFDHEATHISLRFRSQGQGPHKLASCVIHYKGDSDED
jgi:hypothetical protein